MKRALQISAIVLLTVFLTWLFLKNANLRQVGKMLEGANPWWVIAALAINLCTLIFRTIRWRVLLDPDRPPSFYATFFANAVGYMLSSVLPVRAADVARPALLSRRTNHRFSGALGTVLIERMLDLISILVLYIYFVVRRWNEYAANATTRDVWLFAIRPSALICGGILVAVLFFWAGVFLFSDTLRRLHSWFARFIPKRFQGAWMHFFDAFAQGIQISRNAPAFSKVLACTLGIWFCLTMQFMFAVYALHLHLPIDSSFFVTGTTTVGLALPTPGGIGGMHKICQWVLTTFYRFSMDEAVASAVLFWLVGTIPVLVLGLTLFVREGLRWKDVTRA